MVDILQIVQTVWWVIGEVKEKGYTGRCEGFLKQINWHVKLHWKRGRCKFKVLTLTVQAGTAYLYLNMGLSVSLAISCNAALCLAFETACKPTRNTIAAQHHWLILISLYLITKYNIRSNVISSRVSITKGSQLVICMVLYLVQP